MGAGIAVWLAAHGGIKLFEYLGEALLVLALLGLLYGGVLHIEDIGAKKQAVIDGKVLEVCKSARMQAEGQRDQALTANKDLGTQLTTQNASVDLWKATAVAAQQRAEREMNARLAIQKLHNVKIAADAAIIKGPAAVTKEKACEDAAAITGGLVHDLVQQH